MCACEKTRIGETTKNVGIRWKDNEDIRKEIKFEF